MTQSARLETLERKVRRLERVVSRAVISDEEDRIRARKLVLAELREHGQVDGVKLAIKHDLNFGDVQEALDDLEKMGSAERVED